MTTPAPAPNPPHTSGFSANTLKQYKSVLNRLTQEELLPLLQKHPKLVIHWINSSASPTGSIQTQNSYISTILWHLRSEYPSADVTKYVEEGKRLQLLRNEDAKKQTLPPAKLESLMAWSDVLALKEKAKEQLNDEDHLLYLLYTEMPPLRADFCNLRILFRNRAGMTGNYIIISKKKMTLVLQDYKTAKTFGKREFVLPEAVVEQLKRCFRVIYEDVVPPSILNMTENALSKRVSSIFEKLSGKSMSINLLRHSFVKQFLATPRTILEKEQMALRMLHSKTLQEQYDVLPQPEPQPEPVVVIETAPEEEATLSDEEHSLDFLA